MLKNSFANAEEFYKVKNFQTTICDMIEEQYSDDAEFQQISDDFYNVLTKKELEEKYGFNKTTVK